MKSRFILNFPPQSSDKPITYHLIKNYDLLINILRAEVTPGKEGRLLIEVEAEENNLKAGLAFLEQEHIRVFPLSRKITLRQEECVHCGACTAVCISRALNFNRQSWELEFKPEECVACGLCVKACPLRLFTLDFGA